MILIWKVSQVVVHEKEFVVVRITVQKDRLLWRTPRKQVSPALVLLAKLLHTPAG